MKTIRWVVLTATAAVAVGAFFTFGGGTPAPAQAQAGAAVPEVTVAEVMVRPVAEARTYTGRLQAVDRVAVRPRVGGYVTEVDFTEGAMVEKGQLLFRIDPRPYRAEVDRLKASLAAAQSELRLARANDERAGKLVAKHYISEQHRDALDSAHHSAAAKAAATRAQLQAAQLDLRFTEVRAPVAGRVSNVRITPGNLVSSEDVLTELVGIRPLYAYFDVDEHAYLQLLGQGHADVRGGGNVTGASVTMGLADEDGFPHHGRIDFVDNRIDDDSGTIRLRAVFDNHDGELVPGLFARLNLATTAPQATVLVDPRAIGTDLGNRFVYVLDDAGKVAYRQVEPGTLFHGLRVVRKGLEAGDRIIVDGLQRVRPGVAVHADQVAMDAGLDADQRALVNGTLPGPSGADDGSVARR